MMKALPLFVVGCAAHLADDAAYLADHGVLVMSEPSMPGTPLAQSSIYAVRADGSDRRELAGSGNQYPSWTPDGRIVFVSNRSGSPQIWIMDADGGNAAQLGSFASAATDELARVQMADDGTIAFKRSGDGIYLMDRDGANLRAVVTFANGAGDAPSLARSGRWLSYTAPAEPGHNEIFRIDADGSHREQLTFSDDPDYPDGNASAIAPDEQSIAIYTGVESHPGDNGFGEHHNIALIGPHGGARTLVTRCDPATPDDCLTSDNPSWSRDGRWIVYDRGGTNADHSGTYALDTQTTAIQRLNAAYSGGGSVPLHLD
jgi:Tol biopolymer transport system component